jgi:hypothetical protein
LWLNSSFFFDDFFPDVDLLPSTVDAIVRNQTREQQNQLDQSRQPLHPVYSHPAAVIQVQPGGRSPGRQQAASLTKPPLPSLSVVNASSSSVSKSTAAATDATSATDLPADSRAAGINRKSMFDALPCCRTIETCRSPASIRACQQCRRIVLGLLAASMGVVSYIGVARSINAMFKYGSSDDVVSDRGQPFSASLLVVYVVTLCQTFVYPAQIGVRFILSGRKMSIRDAFRLVTLRLIEWINFLD